MNNLMIDSIFVMLVCFALGAAAAWLLAAALYPTRGDVEQARRERGRLADGRRALRGDDGRARR